jgi:hypothetical protein
LFVSPYKYFFSSTGFAADGRTDMVDSLPFVMCRLFYLEELCCVRSWGREGSVPRRRRSLAGCFLWYVRGDLCMAQRCCYGGGGGCLCVIHTVWDVRIVVVFEWS